MFKVSFIFWVLLWIAVPAVQQDTDFWYFAYNKDNGSLVAYTLAGQTNTLIETGVTGLNVIGTQISDNEALLLLRVDEEFGLYHATSNQITFLVGEDGILQVPLASTEGAAVMINNYAGQPVYASLFKDGTLTALPNRVFGSRTYARFSQDGRFFRYIGADENDNIALWNYDTATGQQTAIFDFGVDVPVLRVDTHGEHWMQRMALADGKASYHMIDLDGHVDDLGTFDEAQVTGSFHVLGNELIAYPAICESDCPFEVRSVDGIQTFQGDINTFRSLPVARINGDSLLMLSHEDQFYKASIDAPPQLIGSFTRDQFHIWGSSFLAVSPDRRWLMTVDDRTAPTQHYLHDLMNGEIVATYNYGEAPYLQQVIYGDGLVALKFNDNSYDFLLYNTDGTYEIVHQARDEEIRVYFDLLPDQKALYRSANPFTGIYMHDIKTGAETPILEGAWEFIRML